MREDLTKVGFITGGPMKGEVRKPDLVMASKSRVDIDVEGAKITVLGETAWFSTTGTLTSGDEYEKAYPFYLEQMRDLLMDEKKSLDDRLTDATHFGVNRLRDRMRGKGAKWPFVITAVLVKMDGKWVFHTIHWSFPAE